MQSNNQKPNQADVNTDDKNKSGAPNQPGNTKPQPDAGNKAE